MLRTRRATQQLGGADPAGVRGKLLLIAAIILEAELAMNTSEFISGVYVTRLPGGCDLSYYDTTTQAFFTVVLSCPHLDMIRLCPWPVVSPWSEDINTPGQKERGFYLPSYF